MGDWLGTGIIAHRYRTYRSFKKARAFARKLKLKNWVEWRHYCKGELKDKPAKPHDIPTDPKIIYKDSGWKGVGDWLGTGRIANRDRTYRTFTEARAFVRKLKLKSWSEWKQYSKGELNDKPEKPDDIPFCPDQSYKDSGWKGAKDWFGY